MKCPWLVLLNVLLLQIPLNSGDPVCPTCDTYTGKSNIVCGYDGVTYSSECELFISLCQSGLMTIGRGIDINSLPIPIMVSNYKNNDGKCVDDGGNKEHCPDCTNIVNNIAVCDTSGNPFNSSCAMAEKMCEDGVISYDDGFDFTNVTEREYRIKINVYVNWEGKCTGPCSGGTYSVSGQVPCVKCGPGSISALNNGSTSCDKCPQDSYQPNPGSILCIKCPNGTDTLQPGATDINQCLSDCVSGHISSTGKAPCTKCSAGQWTDEIGATSCKNCGTGKYSTGDSCIPCGNGTYNDQINVQQCSPCAVGNYSNTTGALACVACGAGTFSNITGMDVCSPCGVGTFTKNNGSTSCTLCAPGSYQVELGKEFCYKCPMGTSQKDAGRVNCPECPLSTYQDSEGQSSCIRCPDRQGTESRGSMSISECQYNECEVGSKVIVLNNKVTCIPCDAGMYQDRRNQTKCHKCAYDTYQNSNGARNCLSCPFNHVTYMEGADSQDACEGPQIQLSTGTNMYRGVATFIDRRDRLDSYLSGKVRSFKVISGDWYIFSGSRYSGNKIRVSQGMKRNDVNDGREYPHLNGLSQWSFYSIRPVVTNVMCYAERGLEYIGYRTKTNRGVTCQNWKSDFPHRNPMQGRGTGNHNYCRNPDNDSNGPWCYTTDPDRIYDYCGVPKCIWNVDCYTERGEFFRGTQSRTAGSNYACNDWYSDFPHPHKYDRDRYKKYGIDHHPYCRNPSPGDDDRPWCYTTFFFQRWAYCGINKCEFSDNAYFKRKHHPKTHN